MLRFNFATNCTGTDMDFLLILKEEPRHGTRKFNENHDEQGRFSTSDATGSSGAAAQGTERINSPPIREDGRIELTHYSVHAGLTELDPTAHGTGYHGAERRRKDQDPEHWVDRTYHGLATGKPGGYERESGLGSNVYTSSVPASKLYDFAKDPDKLYKSTTEYNSTNGYEKAIKDKGYAGYWVTHPSMGLVAATFNKITPEKSVIKAEFKKFLTQGVVVLH